MVLSHHGNWCGCNWRRNLHVVRVSARSNSWCEQVHWCEVLTINSDIVIQVLIIPLVRAWWLFIIKNVEGPPQKIMERGMTKSWITYRFLFQLHPHQFPWWTKTWLKSMLNLVICWKWWKKKFCTVDHWQIPQFLCM